MAEKRLIDIHKVIDKMQECIDESSYERDSIASLVFGEIIKCLKKEPTVDAVEVVHGRWIKNWCNNSFIGHEYAECSVCDCHMLDTNQFWNSNYCPNCGARMDAKEDFE